MYVFIERFNRHNDITLGFILETKAIDKLQYIYML